MEDGKRKPYAEASSSTISMGQIPSNERESGSPLPDSPEKNNEPSESKANSEPPASYADVIGNNYYVFLSFRGFDTRRGFVDHLYHELARVGLHHPNFEFRDDESLRFGEPIAENLLSAIKRSKVSIPVISKNYAASKWCLREIIQIMKCVESGQQKVYPVLYKVTTDYVKDMQGEFWKAFRNPENGFDEELKREGSVALGKALGRRVFKLEDVAGYKGKLVKALVKEIMREQQLDFLSSPVGVVGIDDHVAEVMKLANATSSETHIIVIYGIGGIGKTTLATAIYKKLSNKFECSSFLKDIRETIKNKGMKYVQSLHISNLTENSDHSEDVSNIKKIQTTFEKKKVLIFLDDVDCQDHLDNLIGGWDFDLGSWIIITCRDKALLKSEYKGYKLEEMNHINSLILFSRYAFEGEKPTLELADLSNDIVVAIGGLPLALVIIGSFLKGKSQSIWTETLEKLRKVPHTDVQQKLRISYDSLEYEEQQMFLDIACFFIGINKIFAAYLWKDLQYYLESGLERMTELSLIKIDDNDEFIMHDQLRDFGRAIACPAQKKLWKCSRLWDEKAIIVQRSKEENRYIEALRLDENGSNMFMNQRNFKRMPYLKFLHLKVDYIENFEDSLSELRWLKWEKCPNSFGVTNLHLEKLLILDLSYGYIRHEWRGWSSIKMERLKVLNLSHCFDLVITPNLSVFKSLEILILEYCRNLEKIDPSIGDAKCLTSLNLSDCHKIKKLPSQLGELRRLISLNLSSCETLEELPKEMGKLEELKELTIDFVEIKVIPPSIDSLTKLEILSAQACESLVGLPDSISHLVNLSTLDLRWCNELKNLPESIGSLVKLQCLLLGNMLLPSEDDSWHIWDPSADYQLDLIPDSIGELVSLTELHLTCAKISELPESIGDLKSLKILKIAGCKELSSLPSTLTKLGKLEELDATACDSLEGGVTINEELSSLKILQLGKLGHAVDLFKWQENDGLSSQSFDDLYQDNPHPDLIKCHFPANLTVLEVTCQNHELPQLSHLIHLKELSFQFCKFLESIPLLPSGILNLSVVLCGELKKLPSLLSLESLSELLIIGCGELMEIEGLKGLKSLGGLFLCECKKLPNLNGLEHLESLRQLEIDDLDALKMNDNRFQERLGRLKNLERLRIARCQSLTTLDISQLTHIRELYVFECEKVDEIKGLEELKKLTYLDIEGCKSITKLPDLSLFDNLRELNIEGCENLHDVRGLEKVKFVSNFGALWNDGGSISDELSEITELQE